MPLEGLKVVTAQEMARIEKIAYSEGASEQTFMENAGRGIAEEVQTFIEQASAPKVVTLLIGKGNNGGDAFATGIQLLKKGIKTVASHLFKLEACSPLCQVMHKKFLASGGRVHKASAASFSFESGVILDGLVGTGFQGKAEGVLALAIDRANRSRLPIIAIDIPSGLHGSTGEVETVAIQATQTLFLGLPKIGFFLKKGWDHVGKLKDVDFGLQEKYISKANAVAYLLNESGMVDVFPSIKRTRHKYQAGYVLSIAGSRGMPGAALLASLSALRAGAGIVRLFHPKGMEAELSGAPFELIREGWDGKNMKRIGEEMRRAKVMLIGPGIGRTSTTKGMVQQLLRISPLPLVIDADALYFLAENPSWRLPKGSILTPHQGEMQLLLSKFKNNSTLTPKNEMEHYQIFAQKKQVTIVLKGAPTFIFCPETMPLIVTRGDPGMATAGSGDVLTGVIAAMLAQGLDARSAASLSVYLHGMTGEMAAHALTSYCMIASDLITFLPNAFKQSMLLKNCPF